MNPDLHPLLPGTRRIGGVTLANNATSYMTPAAAQPPNLETTTANDNPSPIHERAAAELQRAIAEAARLRRVERKSATVIIPPRMAGQRSGPQRMRAIRP